MSETLPKNFDPAQVEGRIYDLWLQAGAFRAIPDGKRPTYVVMMPLPNVTGALHMGHAMDNVMQDMLVRWHRMMGDDTLWQPGTDHAGIATQAVVEKRLKELEGLTRHDLGREGLVARIWQWKDQYQQRIVSQQQRMGCSCDWDRQRFTMDAVCARAVRHAFLRLFEDGLVVRGKRLVNWDPFLQTSISDDEVYHETVQGHFWYLRYPVLDPKPGEPSHVVVATTRPETMLGDTAVAVHPDPEGVFDRLEAELAERAGAGDEAARAELEALRERRREVLPLLVKLRDMARDGRHVMLPLMERPIPLILDEWAKPELGTGAVKITPAHDPNDYDVWTRHKDRIGIINILNADGTIADTAPPYAGLDRYEARERVVADLDAAGLLERVEDREVEIGHSDRSKTPIEPWLSDQWFIRMGDVEGGVVMGRGTPREHRAPGLVQAAMDAVTEGRVRIHPERYTKTYLDWLAEKRDWPVSRQLWWGHRIPVWSLRTTAGQVEAALLDGVWGEGAAVRAQGEGFNRALRGPEDVAALADLGADTDVFLDVCLLGDGDERAALLESRGFERDPDVLDTWFSSALWPFSTLGWPDPATAPIEPGQAPLGPVDGHPDSLSTYYPGSCLVTGRDIITLWVARMVLSGLYALGDVPFTDVFIHANILDGKGERMSKSKGNGIDPVDIIEGYGADAMRYVLCDMQTGTQDIRLPVTAICPACGHHNDLGDTKHGRSIFTYRCGETVSGRANGGCGAEFDVLGTMPDIPAARLTSERFEIGRAFATKLWNSARFALMNLEGMAADEAPLDRAALAVEDRWILDRLDAAVRGVRAGLEAYDPSGALQAARDFFWGELCDWYLEVIKPRVAGGGEGGETARRVLAFAMDQVLRLLHPFIPFITEYLWQELNRVAPRRGLGFADAPPSEQLVLARWPEARDALVDPEARAAFADLQSLVGALREFRSSRNIPLRQAVDLTVATPRPEAVRATGAILANLVHVDALVVTREARARPGDATVVTGEHQLIVHDVVDVDAERARLEAELKRVDKEIAICDRKLGNPKFVERAPAHVVQQQRDRRAGYEAQKQRILDALAALAE